MPTRATMTVIGLYNYDDTLFENLQIPSGMDTSVAINKILYDNGVFEVIYPNPDLLKSLIGPWSLANAYKWDKLYATELLSYNPLYNVDANESETVTKEYTESGNGSYSDGNTRTLNTLHEENGTVTDAGTSGNTRTLNTQHEENGTVTDAGTSGNTRTLDTATTADTVNGYAGFNSSSFKNVTNMDGDGTETGTITDAGTSGNTRTLDTDTSDTGTVTDAGTSGNTRTLDTDTSDTGTVTDAGSGSSNNSKTISETLTTTRTRTGNIGVTMASQLIAGERETANFSTYDIISEDFKKAFCVMIY